MTNSHNKKRIHLATAHERTLNFLYHYDENTLPEAIGQDPFIDFDYEEAQTLNQDLKQILVAKGDASNLFRTSAKQLKI